jgi:hypothetical protein
MALSAEGLFQRASATGVTFLEAIWRDAPAAVLQMARGSPQGGDRFVLAVGVDPGSPETLPAGLTLEGPRPTIIPMVRDPNAAALQSPGFGKGIGRAREQVQAPCWGAAWSSATEAAIAAPAALRAGARLLAVPASLVGFDAAEQVGLLAREAGAGVVGLDPMASGSLDGSFLDGSPLDRTLTSRPPTVSELSSRFGPVTRLGFLTEGRRRTLAQAAVRFVLTLPAVVSVSCEFRSPKTIVELARIDEAPPLTPEELERVSRLGQMAD